MRIKILGADAMVPIPLSWQAEALLGGGGVYPKFGAGYGRRVRLPHYSGSAWHYKVLLKK